MFNIYKQNDSCQIFVSLLNIMNKGIQNNGHDVIISKLFNNYIEEKTSSYFTETVEKEPTFCISLPIKNKFLLKECFIINYL